MNLNMTVGQAACRLFHYCVDMLKARCLLPVFAESYQLLHRNQAKEPVAVRV